MGETSKCTMLRKQRGDFKNYLHGKGIDIGAGGDPLVVDDGDVQLWDQEHGDAQMMAGIPDDHFDFVYSSHCLEHMRSVEEALRNWIRILKPGGWLYVVVPDYLLYEKMIWPSRFNSDHKNSFSFLIPRKRVVRDNHFHIQDDLAPLLDRLGTENMKYIVEDNGFNYNFGAVDQTRGPALAQICIIARKRMSAK